MDSGAFEIHQVQERRQYRNDSFSTSALSCALICSVEKSCVCLNFLGCQVGRFCLLTGLFLILSFSTFAQEGGMSNWESSAPSLERTPIHGISASGFCRVLGYVRSQQEVFPNNSGKTMAVLVGDLYREPMFLTNRPKEDSG